MDKRLIESVERLTAPNGPLEQYAAAAQSAIKSMADCLSCFDKNKSKIEEEIKRGSRRSKHRMPV